MQSAQTTPFTRDQIRLIKEFISLDFDWPHLSNESGKGLRQKELSDLGYFEMACRFVEEKVLASESLGLYETSFWDTNRSTYYEMKRRASQATTST